MVCVVLFVGRHSRRRIRPLRSAKASPPSLGEVAHAQDVALPLGHRDDAARVEQVEDVAGLDRLVVGRQHHLVQREGCRWPPGAPAASSALHSASASSKWRSSIAVSAIFEIVARIFLLGLQERPRRR